MLLYMYDYYINIIYILLYTVEPLNANTFGTWKSVLIKEVS